VRAAEQPDHPGAASAARINTVAREWRRPMVIPPCSEVADSTRRWRVDSAA
jgi:hypothetical protein